MLANRDIGKEYKNLYNSSWASFPPGAGRGKISPWHSSLLYVSMPICRERGDDMEDEIRVIARMDRKKKIRLYHLLLDEEKTFSAWLREQVDAYLAEMEPKGKQRKGRGA